MKIVNCKLKTAKGGFTLLELLIVIAIIGILVAMGTVSYSTAQKKARDATRRGDMKAIQNALEQYYAANGNQYPGGTFPNGISSYFSSGSAPTKDPRGNNYSSPTYTTSAYRICCDLEEENGYTGSQQDFCVQNLQ